MSQKNVSGSSDVSLHEQLIEYAARVVNDRHSFNVLEAFLKQMGRLFGHLRTILYKEGNLAEGIAEGRSAISWTVIRKEHELARKQLSENLDDFLEFIRTVLKLAQDDRKFLVRNRSVIGNLFADAEHKSQFLAHAEVSINDQEQFIEALKYLEGLKKEVTKLVSDLGKIETMLDKAAESGKITEKNVAIIETTRFKAEEVLSDLQHIVQHVPGLRNVDVDTARSLGMLAESIAHRPRI